jgi:hypothetical protein
MATKRPSFLKRQKEQKRAQRAQAKRDARREKKEVKVPPHDGAPEESPDDGSLVQQAGFDPAFVVDL